MATSTGALQELGSPAAVSGRGRGHRLSGVVTDLPSLPVLAALLRIDLGHPADADADADAADLLVRRELRAPRDELPPPLRDLW